LLLRWSYNRQKFCTVKTHLQNKVFRVYCLKTSVRDVISGLCLLFNHDHIRQFSISVGRHDYSCSSLLSVWVKRVLETRCRSGSRNRLLLSCTERRVASHRPSPNLIIRPCFGRGLFSLLLVLLQQDGTESEREGRER
jgi:hypothetical protein